MGTLPGNGNSGNVLNTYNWSENYEGSKYYYRIRMTGSRSGNKYSRIIAIGGLAKAAPVVSVANPFHNYVVADIQAPDPDMIKLQLIDNNGLVVLTQIAGLQQGNNRVIMNKTASLPAGMYTLKIITGQNIITKKLIKQ